MSWRPIELVADYWIIQDSDGYTEYVDEVGDNLMFYTKEEAQARIDQINMKEIENEHNV